MDTKILRQECFLRAYDKRKFPYDIKKWRIIGIWVPEQDARLRGLGRTFYRAEVDLGGVVESNWVDAKIEIYYDYYNQVKLFDNLESQSKLKQDIEDYCFCVSNHFAEIKEIQSQIEEEVVWAGTKND